MNIVDYFRCLRLAKRMRRRHQTRVLLKRELMCLHLRMTTNSALLSSGESTVKSAFLRRSFAL